MWGGFWKCKGLWEDIIKAFEDLLFKEDFVYNVNIWLLGTEI